MNGTPRAGPGAVTSQEVQSKSTGSPHLRHHNQDSLGYRILQHPVKRKSRLSGELGLSRKRTHSDRVAIHLALE